MYLLVYRFDRCILLTLLRRSPCPPFYAAMTIPYIFHNARRVSSVGGPGSTSGAKELGGDRPRQVHTSPCRTGRSFRFRPHTSGNIQSCTLPTGRSPLCRYGKGGGGDCWTLAVSSRECVSILRHGQTKWTLRSRSMKDSFLRCSPPQHFFDEIAGFETSFRPYLLKHGAPCPPDVIVRQSFANKIVQYDQIVFFISLYLVLNSHETFVKGKRWFIGRGNRKIGRSRILRLPQPITSEQKSTTQLN